MSNLMPLQQLAPDHHALNLRRALADQQQRRVAVQTLDLVLLGIAIATVDAEALPHAEPTRPRNEQLRHARLQVRAIARVLQARGALSQQACRFDLRAHVSELELDRLVLCDRLAERPALLRVAQRQLKRALRDA